MHQNITVPPTIHLLRAVLTRDDVSIIATFEVSEGIELRKFVMDIDMPSTGKAAHVVEAIWANTYESALPFVGDNLPVIRRLLSNAAADLQAHGFVV